MLLKAIFTTVFWQCTRNTVRPTLAVLMSGPVVRIQPNHLSFSSPAAHNEIYGFKSKFGKGEFYIEILSEYGKSSIVSAMQKDSFRCVS
jgi:hypothetical protein